jgi:hypothetical protein
MGKVIKASPGSWKFTEACQNGHESHLHYTTRFLAGRLSLQICERRPVQNVTFVMDAHLSNRRFAVHLADISRTAGSQE